MNKRFESVESEISTGRLWRAKEILSGMLVNAGYDVELYEKMGVVLLQMGDDREAGKYLFLSGFAHEEADRAKAAIGLFLSRTNKASFADFWSSMPASAKHIDYVALPSLVKHRLSALEFDQDDIVMTFKRFAAQRQTREISRQSSGAPPGVKSRITGWLIFIVCILFAIGLFYQAVMGLYAIWVYF